MTTRQHGRAPVPLIDPRGCYYPTATQAALANLVRPSTALMNAKLGRNGWRLATEQDRPVETNGAAGS